MKKIGENVQATLYKLIEAFGETAVGFLVLYFGMPLCVDRWQIFEESQFLNLLFMTLGICIYAIDVEIPKVKSFKTKKTLGNGVINVLMLMFLGRALWTFLGNDWALTGAKHMVLTVGSLSIFGEFFRLNINWIFKKE